MKITTSIAFEVEMTNEEIEAYNKLSDEEKETRMEEMKSDLAEMITDECVGETKFTKFTIEVQEGE
jgi:hypothetical protein